MAYLKYDTDRLESTAATYESCVSAMEDLRKNMQSMVDDLKTGWKTDAGKAFFDKYNDEWLKGFNQYKEVLDHMADNLKNAQSRYEEVTREASKLSL